MTNQRRYRIPIDPVAFGQVLREVRMERKMSQEGLAFAMIPIWARRKRKGTISSAWVKQAEMGRMKTVDRERIACAAEALGVPVTRLLPSIDVPPGNETDVTMALRSYGLTNDEAEKFLADIDRVIRERRQRKQGSPTDEGSRH